MKVMIHIRMSYSLKSVFELSIHIFIDSRTNPSIARGDVGKVFSKYLMYFFYNINDLEYSSASV